MTEGWTRETYQEIILLVGSKKEFSRFLGLAEYPKEANLLYKEFDLVSPMDYVRAMDGQKILEEVTRLGSRKLFCKRYSVSQSSLKKILISKTKAFKAVTVIMYSREELEAKLKHYKTITLFARCEEITESDVRNLCKEKNIHIPDFIDYTFSGHSNAKGRRAELDFAEMRGNNILEDCNRVHGSQAETDFIDSFFGRVNVKSSKQYRYKAQTRKGDPEYWKISLKGLEKSDYLIALCYDEGMKEVQGIHILDATKVAPGASTKTLQRRDLITIDLLSTY